MAIGSGELSGVSSFAESEGMILKRIYPTPKHLFEPVEFKPGMNYIFGKKARASDKRKSLNGIGKSTFLDLIDFCLLASKSGSKRLTAAHKKGLLQGISVVLEFQIEGILYSIQRAFDHPNKEIILKQDGRILGEYTESSLKPVLCDLIFKRENYDGKYLSSWLRKLIPFYLKIQRPKKEKFTDPILYIPETTAKELNTYHLFLMGIDNRLSLKNHENQIHLKSIEQTIAGVREFITDTYGLNDIPEASSRAKKLQAEVEDLEKAIKAFNLNKQYKSEEGRANELTVDIKSKWLENHRDKARIDQYLKSAEEDVDVSTTKIRNLYRDLNSLLADQIKKTLEEAIKFRKDLSQSRYQFIESEVQDLRDMIAKRDAEIAELDAKRKVIFEFLSAKNAITDLTQAFESIAAKRNELNSIQSQIKMFQDLSVQKNERQSEANDLFGQILKFKKTIEKQEYEFSKIFNLIHDSLYPELHGSSTFDIYPDEKKDSKLTINVLTNTEMFSKGRNQGRTLIYDLSMLFHAIEKGLKGPRFLVHDGIFDGMDKAHFIKLYQFLNERVEEGIDFQYIVTYNEEGELKDNFGESDLVTTERIENEAILVLSPTKKLLGDF